MLYERNNYPLFKLLINIEEPCNCREELLLLTFTRPEVVHFRFGKHIFRFSCFGAKRSLRDEVYIICEGFVVI